MNVSLPYQQDNGLMKDLDLDVEEEEQDRGFEPPAHWPSRDSVVQVENLTCHYAPQVRLHSSKQFVAWMLIFSLSLCYEESRSRLVQRRRLGFVVVQDLESRVSSTPPFLRYKLTTSPRTILLPIPAPIRRYDPY